MSYRTITRLTTVLCFASLALSDSALAAEDGVVDTGGTAWMLTATAIVLLMTIPGVALFYAGMVRKINVLATLMQSFAITCLVSVIWMIVGYSLAFSDGGSDFLGNLDYAFLARLSVNGVKGTIPDSIFVVFQL